MIKTIKEEKKRWVLPIINKELKLVDVAKVCPHSKRSLERWVAKYKREGEVGLGLDFLSVALVFDEALVVGPRFFLAQTVVSLLIISGAFLSGPLTRKLLERLRAGELPLSGRWGKIAAVSGSISIISWLTITFIDFFPNITLTYLQLVTIYGLAIMTAFLINLLVERFSLGVAKEPVGITN